MIDWRLAERIAATVGGQPATPRLGADLVELAREGELRVSDYTGLRAQRELPAAETVDRREWIRANLSSMRALLDPVLEQAGPNLGPLRPAVRAGGAVLLTVEVGAVVGFLSQRVLGQYELVLLEPVTVERAPRLLFVAPNLAGAVRSFDADERELLMWIALHEVTHALQFAAVPWLQSHLASLVRELLGSMQRRLDASSPLMRLPDVAEFRRIGRALRRGEGLTAVASSSERAAIDRMQALMALIEGYAEHVMDAVGAELLPSLAELRAALEQRRRSRSAPARILGRLLGLELKMRQYAQGKAFCDAIVAELGIAGLGRVWTSPAAIPTARELIQPRLWIERSASLPQAA